MTSTIPANRSLCADCGAPLSVHAPEGLCLHCLLESGVRILSELDSPSPAAPLGPAALTTRSVAVEMHSTASGRPRLFGDYELLDEIARGGMGVVFRARQVSLNRIVAVKMLKFGAFTRDEFVARFQAEAAAAATLHHPNIVAIHGCGECAGEHFYSMAFIEGPNLADWTQGQPLEARRAAALMLTVTAAVQHAHEHGILHRDLKPSNILLDHEDKPHVSDFGLARRLDDDSSLTLTGQALGSPNYMAPEQAAGARGQAGPRSDIWSLGAIFYFLLTARPPFAGPTVAETMRALQHDEPARPRLLNSAVPADLETICLKCLEKDAAKRYATAQELADDLDRFIRDEPIMARPASMAYRFQKAFRRNKLAFTAAAAAAATLIAGAVVSTWQAVRATRAEGLSNQKVVEVAAALQEAEAISAFLTDVLQSPDPARNGATITVAEMLGMAAKKLETDLASQPARRAKLQATLGRTYSALGLMPEAVPLQEKVRDYYRDTSGPEHPDTLEAIKDLGDYYDLAGRRDEALKLWEELIPLWRKVRGPEHSDTLDAMKDLASSYGEADRQEEALKLREEVVRVRRKAFGPEHPDTLNAMLDLAKSYSHVGRKDEAFKIRDDVLSVRKPTLALRTAAFPAIHATLVAPNGEWKWLHPTDGRDPAEAVPGFHKAFPLPTFDDSHWTAGRDKGGLFGGFGYGDVFNGVEIGRPENRAHRHTAYFRHAFTTDTEHFHLELRCQRDDGIIVYLDGKDVIRDNVQPGDEAYRLHSITIMGTENDSVVHRFPISGTLAAGPHTLAISVHNTARDSSDLYLGGVTLVEVEPAADGK